MQIALNTTPLLGPLTGIGQYIHRLSMELSKLPDHELRCFTGKTWSATPPNPSVPKLINMVSKIRRQLPFGYEIARFIQSRAFRSGCDGTDIYHEPNYLALPFNGKTVITVHDLSWLHHPQYHPAARIRAMQHYFPQSLNQAAHIITVSEFVRKETIAILGVPADKVTCIPLGIEDDCRPRDEAECLPTLNRNALTYKNYFLVVGTLEPRKNLVTILQAYQNLDASIRAHYPLVIAGIAGWGETPFSKRFDALIAAGQVRYLGYLPRTELLEIIAAARGLLYPSIYEGFGLPPLEAMGCGVMPLVSDVSSLPEVVGNLGIRLHPEDLESWQQAMEQLVDDQDLTGPATAQRLVSHARQFTWQKCAAATVEIYRQVTDK